MSLRGKRVLITAGPTREPMDPVRFLTNPSSGEMGFTLASVLKKNGAHVTLVSGPVALKSPTGVKSIPVITALQMNSVVKKEIARTDVFIATAAVGDFRFQNPSSRKIKKEGTAALMVTLVRNPDILKGVGVWKKKKKSESPVLVGFALETTNLKSAAAKKLKQKNLDLIIGNSPTSFSSRFIKPYWLERGRSGKNLGRMSKEKLATRISMWIKTSFDR